MLVLIILVISIASLLEATAKGASSWLDRDQRMNAKVIRLVWPRAYEDQAIRVAYCESRLRRYASNGQYVNLFQMGYSERRRYGWHTAGSSAWLAARAALRYFRASGYSWRAWTCKP